MVSFGVTVAYPGTELYRWALKNKALPDRFWYVKEDAQVSNSIREVSGNINLKDFPRKKQAQIVKKANKEFYLRPFYVLSRIVKIRKFHEVKRIFKVLKEFFGK